MCIAVSAVSVSIVGLLGALLLWSRGKPRLLLDSNGRAFANSISEKTWIEINRIEQGMFIESQNDANPVLLMVHGGPGMPDHFLTQRYPTGLERTLHRGVVGAAWHRALVPWRHTGEDDDAEPIRV
jgi:hypothetical protein